MQPIETGPLFEAVGRFTAAHPVLTVIFLVVGCVFVWINRKRPE